MALLNHALGSVSYSCALKIILRALQELFLRYKSPCFHYDCPPVIITIRKRFSPSVIEVPLQYTGPLCLELLIIEATFNNQLLCQQSVTQQLWLVFLPLDQLQPSTPATDCSEAFWSIPSSSPKCSCVSTPIVTQLPLLERLKTL